jgi:hypothetical protein
VHDFATVTREETNWRPINVPTWRKVLTGVLQAECIKPDLGCQVDLKKFCSLVCPTDQESALRKDPDTWLQLSRDTYDDSNTMNELAPNFDDVKISIIDGPGRLVNRAHLRKIHLPPPDLG